jgi:zinc protease
VRAALLAAVVFAGACASTRPAPPPPPAPAPPVPVAAPEASSAPPPVASAAPVVDEPFRQHAPDALPPTPFVVPAPTHAQLHNGIPVTFVPQVSPFVALRVIAAGGIPDVGGDKVEVVTLMLRSMRTGTTSRSFSALEDAYVTLDMPEPQVWVYPDAVAVSLVAPADKLRAMTDLAADIVLRPSFDAKLLERWREQDARRREGEASDAALVAERVLRGALFGNHPYGTIASSPARIRAVTRAEATALQGRVFEGARISLVVSGGARDKEVVAALDDAFGALKRSAAAAPHVPTPRLPSARIVVVDQPGTAIAAISGGFVGPAAPAHDVDAAVVAIDSLADASLGKATGRLRDELGIVPSMTASWWQLRSSGYLGYKTRTANDQVAVVLAEIDRAVRALASQGPSDQDFSDVRDRDALSFASSFETAADTTRTFGTSVLLGQPPEAVTERPRRLAQLTSADVRAAAAKYLDGDKMRVVVVGDWSKLEAPLTALGWGPIELRDADGAVVPRKDKGHKGKHD